MTTITSPIPGGMGIACVLSCAAFAAINGSSIVTMLAIGSVMYPAMVSRGYSKSFALGAVASAGTLGIIIPPSIPLILYGIMTERNIAQLFVAGIGPGLLLSFTMAALCLLFARKRNYPKGEVIPLRQALKICADALWGLMTMVIILGGILSGVFTPTESASIAVLWAFFVTMFIYRDYRWAETPKLVHRTVKTLSIVMILIAFAASFGYIMTLMQIPLQITTALTTLSDNRYVILALINLLLLVLGTLMDMAPLILILTPILLPVIKSIGVDPVHFGMIMMVNLGIGLLTPPVGGVLFVGAAVAKLPMEQVVKALLPFFGALLLVLIAVTYIPALSLWLPGLLL